jgi:hypothetical protein
LIEAATVDGLLKVELDVCLKITIVRMIVCPGGWRNRSGAAIH